MAERRREKSGISDGGYQIRSRKNRKRGSKNLSGQWWPEREDAVAVKQLRGGMVAGEGGPSKGAYLGGLRLSRREGIRAGDS